MDYTFVAAAFSIAIKLVAGGMILFFAEVKHRKTSLPWGLAWIAYAYAIAGDISGSYLTGALSTAIFASLIFYGTTKLIGAESYFGKTSGMISLMPVLFTLILISGVLLYSSNVNFLVMGISHALSGLFTILSGFLLVELKEIYGSKARNLGIILVVYGIHQIDYLVLRKTSWFAPAGFILGLILTLVSAVLMVQFVLVFPIGKKSPSIPQDVPAGIIVIKPEEVQDYIEMLKKYPVLAFFRTIQVPEEWTAFKLSNISERFTIPPTNLPRILETAVEYLRRVRENEDGFRPVIFLEGLEYMKLYNDFSGLAKFLATLKDYVNVNNGTLIVILDEKVWDKKELNFLKRILM